VRLGGFVLGEILVIEMLLIRHSLLIIIFLIPTSSFGQDQVSIRVHFLYGSKPVSKYKDTEPKWFGGKWGGHVGIEVDSGQILNFVPRGKFHIFSKHGDKHSAFVLSSTHSFYSIFTTDDPSIKKAIIQIPISKRQKQLLDSIARQYVDTTPYDYAFFGMRCGSAAYEILGQIKILPGYSVRKIARRIFYPKRLRKRLFKLAETNNWIVFREDGSSHRKWEKD
jgi:hypothetical protein